MKLNRILSAILAGLMLLSTVACAADTPGDDTVDTTTVADTTTEETTVPETEEYIAPEVTYDGAKITVASYFYEGVWEIHKYHFGLHEENGDVINDGIVKRNLQVEEELDVVIELYPLNAGDRKDPTKIVNFVQSGDPTLTFALPMAVALPTLLTTKNMLVDLRSIDTLDLSKSWWNPSANEEYTIYGKQLAAVGDISLYNLGAPMGIYFAKNVIEDHKLENPYDLVREGTWTHDTLIEMAYAVEADLNGDGKRHDDDDRFGLGAESESISTWLLGSGVRFSERNEDGDVVITINTQKTVGILDKLIPVFSDRNVSRLNKMSDKNYGFIHADLFMPKMDRGELLFMSFQLLGALNMRSNESDFGIVPTPKYDEKQEEYYSFGNSYFSDHLVVPQSNGDLDMTGTVLNALGYYSQQYVTPEYIDRSVKTKAVRDEDAAEMVDLIYDIQIFDVAYIFDWGKVQSTVSQMVQNGQTSFTTEYAKIATAVQTALNDTLKTMKES